METILTLFLGLCAAIGFFIIWLVVSAAIINFIESIKNSIRNRKKKHNPPNQLQVCHNCKFFRYGPNIYPCTRCIKNPQHHDCWQESNESDDRTIIKID